MPTVRRPRRGSMAFYPKKRARRIYPRIKSYPEISDAKPLAFAGYKAGMTHALIMDTNPNSKTKGQMISIPTTILECPPLSVFGFRCYSQKIVFDVFSDKLNKNLGRKIKLPKKPKNIDEQLKNIPQKISSISLLCHTNPNFKKKPEIFEIALGGSQDKQLGFAKNNLGKEIKVSDIFKAGDYIDVLAVTKGKGFEGPVKRFGVRIHGRKADQMARHTGALGPREPGKIRHTVPMAGQLGFQTRCELNKRILMIDDGNKFNPKGGFVKFGLTSGDATLIEGSIPGSRKRLIRFRFAIRSPKTKYPVDIKYISQESKQGV